MENNIPVMRKRKCFGIILILVTVIMGIVLMMCPQSVSAENRTMETTVLDSDETAEASTEKSSAVIGTEADNTASVVTDTVRIAIPDQLDENLELQENYTEEYLKKMSQFMGCTFEYILCAGDTADDAIMNAMEKVRSGEADMMGMILKNDTLNEIYDYPENGYGTVYTILSALEGNGRINETSIYEMKTIKVAVIKGANMRNKELETFCNEKHINYTVVECEDMEEQYQMLAQGKADLMLRVSLNQCDGTKQVVSFAPRPFYFIVSKGNTALALRLEDAINSINEVFPFYQSGLYNKYFADTASGFNVTEDQRNYLTAKKTLRVLCLTDAAPYVFADKTGKVCGISVDVMDGFASAADIAVDYETYDGQADFTSVYLEGGYDCVLGIPVNESYNNSKLGIITSNPYTYAELVTFSKNSALKKPPEDCVVALLRGSDLAENMEAADILYYDNTEACIRAVTEGEADMGYGLRSCVEYAANDLFANVTMLPMPGKSYDIGISLSKQADKRLIVLINQYIDSLSAETLYEYYAAADAVSEKNGIELYARENPAAAAVILAGIFGILVLCTASIIISRMNAKRNEVLQKALTVKSDFLSRMSHDLRTPLNAIVGMSDLGRNSNSLAEAEQYHETVYSAGKYLLGLINDTLDMSKMDSDKMVLNLQPCQLKSLSASMEEVLRPLAREKQVRLTMRVNEPSDSFFMADTLRMEQIFMNLLNNAIKFTPSGGSISFTAEAFMMEKQEVHLRFTVEDTGIGMSREFQNRMYEPFEQENDVSMGNESGTGLGLAIVGKLVALMNGKIICTSETGKGTRYVVEMNAEPAASVEVTAVTETDLAVLMSRRILVAEDHPLNRQVITKLLQNHQILVECAENGRECLKLYQSHPAHYYDAILMDIRMPVMNGLETAKAIRAQGGDALIIPIIAMTANAFEEDREASFAAGMNAHLAKPVEPSLLYQTLIKYCEGY